MSYFSRWLPAALLSACLAFAAFAPGPAQAGNPMIRVIVDLPDIVFRSGYPYYRYGGYGYDDRLFVERDRYGRPIYYRYIPRDDDRYGPPYGRAYGYHQGGWGDRYRYTDRFPRHRCDRHGNCWAQYDARRYGSDDEDDDDEDRWRQRRHGHHGWHDDD